MKLRTVSFGSELRAPGIAGFDQDAARLCQEQALKGIERPDPSSFSSLLACPCFLLFFLLASCTKAIYRARSNPPQEDATAQYERAIKDAETAEHSEISDKLIAITDDNKKLFWKSFDGNRKILMVTWTSWDGYDGKENALVTLGKDVWVTAVPELKKFCGHLTIDEPLDLYFRLKQYLGLPPNSNKTKFVEMWVNPSDLFRPCPDPEITDTACQLSFPAGTPEKHKKWISDLTTKSYQLSGYPWTRLGYTYDWGNRNNEIGANEFVISSGSMVTINSIENTTQYCHR